MKEVYLYVRSPEFITAEKRRNKVTNIEKKGYHPVTLRIYKKDMQMVLEDEILCAYDTRSQKILAIGTPALSYIQDDSVAVVNPLKWGVVADYIIFCKVIAHFVKMLPASFRKKPKIALCVPAKLTEVEKQAFCEVFTERAGKPFYLVEKSFEGLMTEGTIEDIKGVNYYVEFVSEYYASEYFV